ncbi:MAG: peptidase C15 [Pseudomonadota bacterium]
MTPSRPLILVSGFGPFPGVPVNPSAAVAAELARTADVDSLAGATVAALALDTDWHDGPARLQCTIKQRNPTAVVMFGVSRKARCVVIETLARNQMAAVDNRDRMPTASVIDSHGPRFRVTRCWPARQLVSQLRALGIPAIRSRNAGTYLCNRVLYDTLAACQHSPALKVCGFVHIPLGLVESAHPDRPCHLTWDQAVRAGQIVVRSLAVRYGQALPGSVSAVA